MRAATPSRRKSGAAALWHTRPMLRTLALALLALSLLAGCPHIELRSFGIVDGSNKGGKVTLRAEVEVREEHGVDGEGGHQPAEMRGLVAIALPSRWTVENARVLVPGETVSRRLLPVPQAAAGVGENFPTVEGEWWAFASGTQTVVQGVHSYVVELDVVGKKGTKDAPVAFVVGAMSEKFDDLPPAQEYTLDLRGAGTLKAVAVPVAAEPAAGDVETTY